MHLSLRAVSRLPRAGNGWATAFAAAMPTAARHSSSVSKDEFIKETMESAHEPPGAEGGTKSLTHDARNQDAPAADSSPVVKIRKIKGPHVEQRRSRLFIQKHPATHKPWKTPAQTWPDKPAPLHSQPRVLKLSSLPLGTTPTHIIMSLDGHFDEAFRRTSRIEDIEISSGSDPSTEDVVVIISFSHPEGAQRIYNLAAQGLFKVGGKVPAVTLEHAKDSSQPPALRTETRGIGPIPSVDRTAFFTSQEQRKIVRRTPLMYN